MREGDELARAAAVGEGCPDTRTVLREGTLAKQSPHKAALKRWQTRHFTLTPAALFYRKKKSDGTSPASPLSCPLYPLLHLVPVILPTPQHTSSVTVLIAGHKTCEI
jgi:hypothetical protein